MTILTEQHAKELLKKVLKKLKYFHFQKPMNVSVT